MAKILILGSFGSSLIRFRGDLIKSWIAAGHTVIAAAPEKTAQVDLEQIGVHYSTIPLKRVGLNPLEDIKLVISLIKLLGNIKPDYLFTYTAKPVIYGSLAAYFYPTCRVYSMVTGLGTIFTGTGKNFNLLKKLMIILYRIALKRNEKVFFQNGDDLKEFSDLRVISDSRAVLVNGSGVNLSHYRLAPLPSKPVSFLLIARLLKEKGVFEYIEAARMIKAKYPETVFRMVGWSFDDNPSAIGREQVEMWKQEGIVEIFSETADVRPFIAGVSIYVLPSYREGTPRTVLEAMAMGRAIITTDAPGCRETVVEGVNGFLVPVKDFNTLAEAMERFIIEPELITKMGAASQKIAKEKYDVHKVNRVINEIMGLS